MSSHLFYQITAPENIRAAYLALAGQFDAASRAARYAGVDGVVLNDRDSDSMALLAQVREELLRLAPLAPAVVCSIPKKDGGQREVCLFSVADRIKAQAIAQVVEPLFEAAYSPFLFSYRKGRPSYYAARGAARRYRRGFGRDYVLVADLSQYTDHLNHAILEKQLRDLGFEDQTMALLRLFIDVPVWRNGKSERPAVGVSQGSPLTPLFANLYLNQVDALLGPQAALYRRVGDDLILFDRDQAKLERLRPVLEEELVKLGLALHPAKTFSGRSDQPFCFLGYRFHDGLVSLEERFISSTVQDWRRQLRFRPLRTAQRQQRLRRLLYTGENNLSVQSRQLLWHKALVSDTAQMQSLSRAFTRAVTRYWFGAITPRLQRKLGLELKGLRLPSLFKSYLRQHHGTAV